METTGHLLFCSYLLLLKRKGDGEPGHFLIDAGSIPVVTLETLIFDVDDSDKALTPLSSPSYSSVPSMSALAAASSNQSGGL